MLKINSTKRARLGSLDLSVIEALMTGKCEHHVVNVSIGDAPRARWRGYAMLNPVTGTFTQTRLTDARERYDIPIRHAQLLGHAMYFVLKQPQRFERGEVTGGLLLIDRQDGKGIHYRGLIGTGERGHTPAVLVMRKIDNAFIEWGLRNGCVYE